MSLGGEVTGPRVRPILSSNYRIQTSTDTELSLLVPSAGASNLSPFSHPRCMVHWDTLLAGRVVKKADGGL